MTRAQLRSRAIIVEASDCKFKHALWRQAVIKDADICLCGSSKEVRRLTCHECFVACPDHLKYLKDRDQALKNRCKNMQLDLADKRGKERMVIPNGYEEEVEEEGWQEGRRRLRLLTQREGRAFA